MPDNLAANFRLIVVGASAGGVEAVKDLVRGLPADLPAAVCVVVHFPVDATSRLPQILNKAGRLKAQHATNNQDIEPGCLYVAPPDFHLLVGPRQLTLSRGPRYNGARPAIDPLFRTAARAFGPRTIGVLLSGTLDDGVIGLQVIKSHGGLVMVQDPADAVFDMLPRAALLAVPADQVLPAEQMGAALVRLVAEPAPPGAVEMGAQAMATDPDDEADAQLVARDKAVLEQGARAGEPSLFTCPNCGGVLWELQEGAGLRYRCHVGHSYTADGLRSEQQEALEEALWTALRSLEESAALARRLANRAQSADTPRSARQFEARANDFEERAALVRNALDGLALSYVPSAVSG